MNIRPYEDYYHWCCEWCDSENSVLWEQTDEPLYCGACHWAVHLGGANRTRREALIPGGRCDTVPAGA